MELPSERPDGEASDRESVVSGSSELESSEELNGLDAPVLSQAVGEMEPVGEGNSAVLSVARHLVAVLFAGGGPVKLEDAARALGVPPATLEGPLLYLRENPPLGLRVQRHNGELELVTDPESAPYIESLLGLDRPTKLSRAALETMAIVAYRQPVTRGDIEAIRGVNSDSAVTTLLNRGLISEVGRKETVGHPTLYGSTAEFLQHLGLDSLEALPPLPE
jgi:segregation and condensation protein B